MCAALPRTFPETRVPPAAGSPPRLPPLHQSRRLSPLLQDLRPTLDTSLWSKSSRAQLRAMQRQRAPRRLGEEAESCGGRGHRGRERPRGAGPAVQGRASPGEGTSPLRQVDLGRTCRWRVSQNMDPKGGEAHFLRC